MAVKAQLVRHNGIAGKLVPEEPQEELRRRIGMIWISWCSGKSKHTLKARSADIRKFGRFIYIDDRDLPSDEVPIESAMLVYWMLRKGREEAEAVTAKFIRWMEENAQTDTTRARAVASLRSWAEHLRSSDAVACNLSRIPVPKFDPYSNAEGPPMEAVVRALDQLNEERMEEPGTDKSDRAARDYAIAMIVIMSLMRREELRNLRWADIGLDKEGRPEAKFVGKGGRRRRSGIGDSGAEALQLWHERVTDRLGHPKKTDFIFCKLNGRQISGARIYQISKRMVGTGPHGMRHTGATAIGVRNLLAASRKLGHKNLSTTKVYMDEMVSTEGEAIEILEGKLGL